MKVISEIFGQGTVIKSDTKTVTVDFNGQAKLLFIKFANLLNEDGSLFTATKTVKAKKQGLPKIDYSKYSDLQLINIHNELLSELAIAKKEARADGKTGTY